MPLIRVGQVRSDKPTVAHNEAVVDPLVTDDVNAGYEIGSIWINTLLDKAWICLDNTALAAVWKVIAV